MAAHQKATIASIESKRNWNSIGTTPSQADSSPDKPALESVLVGRQAQRCFLFRG